MLFWGRIVICDLYLFHFIVVVNPVCNCSKSFVSFSFDKVTSGTYNFVSVTWNNAPDGVKFAVISAKPQFLDKVKINSTSQLINGISKLLQKLLKCFSGITTFAFANESLFCGVFPTTFALYLKDSELGERGLLGSSL